MSGSRYTLRLLSLAEQDLAEAIGFIAADDRRAAMALLGRFEQALGRLRDYPFSGRVPDDTELLRLGYRYLVVDNYLVFYVLKRREIIVHRIIHGARDYRGRL